MTLWVLKLYMENCGIIFCLFIKVQLREQQANEKVAELEKRIQELQTENMQKVKLDSSHNSTELFETYEKLALSEELNNEISDKLCEMQRTIQALELELSNKTKECNELSKEVEEIEMRSTTYFNHLQVCSELFFWQLNFTCFKCHKFCIMLKVEANSSLLNEH